MKNDLLAFQYQIRIVNYQEPQEFRHIFCHAFRLLNLSDGEMADKLGYSENSIRRWKNGITVPKSEDQKIIYAILMNESQRILNIL